MTNLRLLLILLTTLLTACVGSPVSEGIGGTGVNVSEGIGGTGQKLADGIGGTGKQLAEGIGGTGQKLADGIGGTGIIGTVTDFGSIWIHHAHVHWDDTTVITQNGQLATENDFKLGHVVAVLSEETRNGYRANSIEIVMEVVGPISNIDATGQIITVLEQQIELDAETIVSLENGEQSSLSQLQPGHFVQISGLRKANNHIAASRIDVIAPVNTVEIIGKLDSNNILGQTVDLGETLHYDSDDQRLLVKGQLDEKGVLIVDDISKDAILHVIEHATDLMMEGFLFDHSFDGDIVVGGIDLVLPDALDLDLETEDPVFIDAELGDDELFYADDFFFSLDEAEEYLDFDLDLETEEWIEAFDHEFDYEDIIR